MPISLSCPVCGSKIRAPDQAAGRRVACPKCGEPLTVPTAAGPTPDWVGQATPPAQPPAGTPVAPAQDQTPPARDSPTLPWETAAASPGVCCPKPRLAIVVSAYIRQNLMPGERLIATTHMHPKVLIGRCMDAAIGLLLIGCGYVIGDVWHIILLFVGIPIAVLATIAALVLLVEVLTTEYTARIRRIVHQGGSDNDATP